MNIKLKVAGLALAMGVTGVISAPPASAHITLCHVEAFVPKPLGEHLLRGTGRSWCAKDGETNHVLAQRLTAEIQYERFGLWWSIPPGHATPMSTNRLIGVAPVVECVNRKNATYRTVVTAYFYGHDGVRKFTKKSHESKMRSCGRSK
jgi:hypothetical protein